MSDESDFSGEEFYDEEAPMKCLFCSYVISVSSELFTHMNDVHSFDFNAWRHDYDLTFYDCIRLINYIRTNPDFNINASKVDVCALIHELRADDSLLVPFIENDPLLYLFDDEEEDADFVEDEYYAKETRDVVIMKGSAESNVDLLTVKLQQLETEKKNIEAEFMRYKDEMKAYFMQLHGIKSEDNEQQVEQQNEEKLDGYFESYSHVDIHEVMLKDRVRTEAYRDFVYSNKHLFRDKAVLDVGCGTGILSLFASKAGARVVYAVDNSHMLKTAKAIAEENKVTNIEFIAGKVEDVCLPEKVDIIISEWMGYFLLFEGMLDSVIAARDKWLKPGGHMLPNRAIMKIAAVQDEEFQNDKFDYWNDVYGFKMECMKSKIDRFAVIDILAKDSITSQVATIADFDCQTASVKELDFESPFSLKVTRDGQVDFLCVWFDIDFDVKGCKEPISFSTGPHVAPTHWKQSILKLSQSLHTKEGDFITGNIKTTKSKQDHRSLDVVLTCEHAGTSFQQTFIVE